MADDLLVDPTTLRAAVTEVTAATGALGAAREGLEAAERMARSAMLGAADHKTGTFVRQWREEGEMIASFLDAYQRMFVEVAAIYEQLDSEIARCISDPQG